MVIFDSKKRLTECEKKLVSLQDENQTLKKEVAKLASDIKELQNDNKDLRLTIENMAEDGANRPTAEKLIAEWFLGVDNE